MSEEEERVAEVALPSVKVPAEVRGTINELKYVVFKGDKIRLYTTSDIVREALLKGLRLMLLERKIYDVIIEKEAKEGAERIYASLNVEKPVAEETQAATGTREALEEAGVEKMEEEEEFEEEEPEEGEE